MKKIVKEFVLFAAYVQVPIYGVFLWSVFEYTTLGYWPSWFVANCIYAVLMFPVFKYGLFKKRSF